MYNKLKKVLFLSTSVFFLVFGVSGCSKNNEETNNSLETPKNLKINEQEGTFSWDKVENANNYVFETSFYSTTQFGSDWTSPKEYSVNTNSIDYIPFANKMRFRVKAKDSTNTKQDSEWSSYLEYNVTYETINKPNVITFVSRLMHTGLSSESTRCVDVLGIELEEEPFYDDQSQLKTKYKVRFYGILLLNNVYHEGNVVASYIEPITSVKDLILNQKYPDYAHVERQNESSGYIDNGVCQTYNSLSYYLQSDTYKYELQQYRNNGYTFESVRTQCGENGHCIGTLKVTKNFDVRFFAYRFKFNPAEDEDKTKMYTENVINLINLTLSWYQMSGEVLEIAGLFF